MSDCNVLLLCFWLYLRGLAVYGVRWKQFGAFDLVLSNTRDGFLDLPERRVVKAAIVLSRWISMKSGFDNASVRLLLVWFLDHFHIQQ